ncbi:MAG: ABC-type multidrug transport system, ATPase and permease component [Bacteroidetes bacterium]|nr:ABC-type multidrug transport system, ATPase and permease component [Bacteroidota bacterium]
MADAACAGPAANRPRRPRGAWARRAAGAGQGPAAVDGEPDSLTPSQRERRRQWARLIARVFEVDPLRCPCGGTMRVIAFILNPAVIRKILQHRPRIETRAHGRRDARRDATACPFLGARIQLTAPLHRGRFPPSRYRIFQRHSGHDQRTRFRL